jgi:hypothetical protein
MIGIHPVTRKLLCDLNCHVCGGWKKQGCVMAGGIVTMAFAYLRCMSEGIMLSKIGTPIEFWADHFELNKETCPNTDYILYDNEVVN